jgi:dihydroorotate dehydrogenase
MLGTGATTVEVYSSLVYRGWRVAQRINQELLEILTRQGLPSVESLGWESGPRARR